MKRIIALLIVGILILSLAACGATQNEATADSKAKTGDTTATATYEGWYTDVYVPIIETTGDGE